jgi:hypothetical protein
MNSVMTSINNMHWNRILAIALPIGILLIGQGCAAPRRLVNSNTPDSTKSVGIPANYSFNQIAN